MNVAALMPVKGFRNAKQRLTPLLNSAAREQSWPRPCSAMFCAK